MSHTQLLASQWKELIVGQDHAIDRIVPYIVRYKAGLNAPNRPIGNFFLMGPTGTGKTRTAETLAEVLHKDERKVLRIDCQEFHLEHETAKLIGAPPGYLGHKDTQPLLSQARINGVASEKCDISVVLFDEIEKAHSSFWRLLLGLMDKAIMRMGDNQTVSFEKCVVFMSSNVGAKAMQAAIRNNFGFPKPTKNLALDRIGINELQRKFPPEFPNRVDETITYNLLNDDDLYTVTSLEIKKIQNQILHRLGVRTFFLNCGEEVIRFLAEKGTSPMYGARELKRTITRYIMNPISDDFVVEKIKPGSHVNCYVKGDQIMWDISEPEFTVAEDGSITFNDIVEARE